MYSSSIRLACAVASILVASAISAHAADYAYILSRGAVPTLRGYKIAADGAISSVISIDYPMNTADDDSIERRVLAYASKQKVLVVGLLDSLKVYAVEANGLLTPTPTPTIDFSGTRVGAVEVVEVGSKTFLFVGEGSASSPGIYGYRLLADGSVIALAGFPVSTQNPITDLASVGNHLFSAEPNNNFVIRLRIAGDGTLTAEESARPISPCSQINGSPKGNVLLANADELSYLQEFEYFPKNDAVAFVGLRPVEASFEEPTRIAIGKSMVACARFADDGFGDVRILGVEKSGRTRVLSAYPSPLATGFIDSIALIKNDAVLLVVSDTDDVLESLATDKKTGTVNGLALDTEPIPGLAGVSTLIAIQR